MSYQLTSVDVANAALTRIGSRTIQSLNDGTTEADACKHRYDWCRRAVLRRALWKCAMKRAVLMAYNINGSSNIPLVIGNQYVIGDMVNTPGEQASGGADFTVVGSPDNNIGTQFIATGTTPTWGTGTAILYVSPLFDYLFQVQIPADSLRVFRANYNTSQSTYSYLSERYKLESGFILIDCPTVNLRYVYDLVDVSQMDALLVDCISMYLAYDICYKITQADNLRNEIYKEFNALMMGSRFVDSTEQPAERMEATEWISSRTGLFGGYVTDPLTPE